MFESTLIELLYGKGAHANPIACVEDLSADLAARTIDGFPHSIWQLVNHMNYWMDYELHRIAGACPPYPEHASASWLPESAPPTEADWTQAVSRFRDLIARSRRTRPIRHASRSPAKSKPPTRSKPSTPPQSAPSSGKSRPTTPTTPVKSPCSAAT